MRKIYLMILAVIATVTVNAQVDYFSKAAATDFTDVNSWGTNADGTGTSPASITNADNYTIQNGSVMNLNTASASVRRLTIGAGSLTIASNTLTVSIAAANNTVFAVNSGGTLTVSGGTLNINGRFALASGSKLNQSGGDINVDGNAAGVVGSSVASGTIIVDWTVAVAADLSLTGGTLTIVDPHVASGTNTFQVTYTPVGSVSAGSGHTVRFGDGVSTDNGSTSGFAYYSWNGSGIFKFGNVVVAGGPGGTNRFVQMTGTFQNFVCTGNVTINSGGELRALGTAAGTAPTVIGGNLTVDAGGTYTSLGTTYLGDATSATSTTLTLSATNKAQTISGAGTFRNLVSSPTANFTSINVNNSNAAGVTFSGTNALLSGSNTGTASGTLTMTNGVINTGANAFLLGISGATGTLTYTAGGFGSGSTFRKWVTATGTGTTITSGSVPTPGIGSFPFVNGNPVSGMKSRTFTYVRVATTAAAGFFGVTYNEGAGGITPIAPVLDGAYSIDRQSTASWTVAGVGTFAPGTGNYSFAVSGDGIYSAVNTNGRLMLAASVVGNHQAGTTLPHVQRTTIPGGSALGTYYFGLNSADAATCGNPSSLTATDIQATTVDIAWAPSATGTPASYNWEIRTSGAGGSGAVGLTTSGTTTPPTVSVNDVPGLASGTLYNLYVRTNCTGADGSSAWVGPVSFTTKLSCPGNLGAGTVTVASIPYAATGQTTCGNGNNITSANAVATCGSSSYYGGEDKTYIFTPTVTGVHNILVTTATDDDAGITVYQGCPFTTGSTCVGFAQNTTGLTRLISANLTNGVTYYLVVDNFPSPACVGSYSVNIDPPAACPTPLSVTAGSVTTTTASISWTCLGCTGTFELDYGATGHAAGTGTIITGVTSAYTLNPPLTPNTGYTVYVRQNCGAGLFSSWSTAANFTTLAPPPPNDLVCNAIALTLSGPQDCQNTTNATSVSDPSLPASCSTPNNTVWYTYTPASSGTVVLRLEVPGATSNGLDGWVAWYTATGTCPSLTLTPAAGSVCQEFGPAAGDLDDLTSPPLVGGTTYYIMIDGVAGDVGDFCIRAVPPPTCIAPTGVSVGSITSTTASVSFTGAGTAYIVDYGVSPYITPGTGATTGAGGTGVFTGATSPIAMTGLTPNTTYQYYVRQDCTGAAGGYSTNTSGGTFTTLAPPPVNDDASGAITLTLNGGCTGSPYTNSNGTQGATEKFASCYQQNTTAGSSRATHTVWYKFVTSSTTRLVRVSTDISGGTLADTHVGLFTAGDPSDYSTFTIISCDDDNGSIGTTRSILYASVLPNTTYYVSVDGFNATMGTFCLRADDLDNTMIASTASCAAAQAPSGAQTTYAGQVPIVDANGLIIAIATNPLGGRVDAYTGAVNVSPTLRSASGINYLNRNYLINNTTATNVDVQFFYLASELATLNAADGTTQATMSVVRQSNTTCQANFASANGATQFLSQTGNGTSIDGTVAWVKVLTPSFSNFYLQKSGGPVLPTGLVSFSGEKTGATNKLRWTTSAEQNNKGFEVQRSLDGVNYTAIGFVNSLATGGNSSRELNYTFIDNTPSGDKQFYRLRQEDLDNRSKLSSIVLIRGLKPSILSIGGLIPNPANSTINILVDAPSKDKVTLMIMDVTGKAVMQKQVSIETGSNTIPVDITRLTNGTYLVKLVCSSNCESAVGKFVKQ